MLTKVAPVCETWSLTDIYNVKILNPGEWKPWGIIVVLLIIHIDANSMWYSTTTDKLFFNANIQ